MIILVLHSADLAAKLLVSLGPSSVPELIPSSSSQICEIYFARCEKNLHNEPPVDVNPSTHLQVGWRLRARRFPVVNLLNGGDETSLCVTIG